MTAAAEVVVIGAGQSGLAATRALRGHGISPVMLEAGDRAAGSWPRYYDSLQAFSPARFNSMPGMAFPGDPDRYPASSTTGLIPCSRRARAAARPDWPAPTTTTSAADVMGIDPFHTYKGLTVRRGC